MITYLETDEKDIDCVEEMWKNLIYHLQSESKYFSESYKNRDFKERKKQFIQNAEEGQLRLDIAKDRKKNVGYCVSSIINRKGIFDSIYVEERYRKQGVGKTLMERTIEWMNLNNVTDFEIMLTFGNTEALKFYQSFGFYPKNMILKKKQAQNL